MPCFRLDKRCHTKRQHHGTVFKANNQQPNSAFAWLESLRAEIAGFPYHLQQPYIFVIPTWPHVNPSTMACNSCDESDSRSEISTLRFSELALHAHLAVLPRCRHEPQEPFPALQKGLSRRERLATKAKVLRRSSTHILF